MSILNNIYLDDDKLEEILEMVGVELMYRTSTDLVTMCPFHPNADTPAFNISRESPYLFKCHNAKCGKKGNIFSLLLLKGYTRQEAKALLRGSLVDDDEFVNKISKIFREEELDVGWENINPTKFRTEDGNNGYPAKKYLENRGISESSYKFFRMGYSARKDMVIVPIFNESSSFVGVVGRSIREKRYQYSNGLQRSRIVWNINNASRSTESFLILTEGTLDAVYIWQQGYQNVGAVLGSAMSTDQLDLVRRNFNGIICFFDNDSAGKALTDTLVETVHDIAIYTVEYPPNTKDPGDLSGPQIQSMIRSARPGIEKVWYNSSTAKNESAD